MITRLPAVLMSAVLAAGGSLLAAREHSASSLQLRIVAPADGAIMSGPTVLRAVVDQPALVSSVVFQVDGRDVCTVRHTPFECDWDAGPVIAAHQVRVVANLAAGGRVVQTTRTGSIGVAEIVDVDVVQVTVTVTDRDGRYVTGLPRSAFHVTEDGQPQRISHFYSGDAPLELVVALDLSTSMHAAMPMMKRAVLQFLAAVPARDRVTLLGFNDDTFVLTAAGAEPLARAKTIESLSAWGATALYETLLRGTQILGAQTGRKALIVFTDGQDQGSHLTLADVEPWLQASDMTLYMIGQGDGLTRAPLKQLMERLARPTGGRALSTTRIDELEAAFTELLDEMSHQYVLGYQSTNSVRDDKWREIAVSVGGYPRVRARQGYRATAPAAWQRN